jgi:two-component system sensor kinase FixL
LQQVLVNLVMNAMDAMAETSPDRRQVAISTEIKAANVAVSVRDTGTGLPANLDGTLFTPFITTKSHGLGSASRSQTIVKAWWRIKPITTPGGATFTVTRRDRNVGIGGD